MCQIRINMLKQHAIPNSSLQNLRFVHQKGEEKLAKDELFMQLTHITSDYGFFLRLVNTFTVDTEEYYQLLYYSSQGQQTSKIKPVNTQSRSPRALIKRTSTDMEVSIYPKPLTFIFIATKQKQLFLQLQSMKKQLCQLLILYKYFFHFELLVRKVL